ncbi:hypothetical protein [Rhodococcus sp. NPDC049939]|uniref:hypothetical protein n=1 Tax=Rhodococcus sp. NPDC049939 TaxID=3155511 RepID=UPI0033E3A039
MVIHISLLPQKNKTDQPCSGYGRRPDLSTSPSEANNRNHDFASGLAEVLTNQDQCILLDPVGVGGALGADRDCPLPKMPMERRALKAI